MFHLERGVCSMQLWDGLVDLGTRRENGLWPPRHARKQMPEDPREEVFDPTDFLHVSNGISSSAKICCFLLKHEKTSKFLHSLPEASAHLAGHTPSWNSLYPNSLSAHYLRICCSKSQHGALPLSHGSLGSTSLCRHFRNLDVYLQKEKNMSLRNRQAWV